jgi:uncharacterized protein (TIGR03435 family)
MDSESYDIDAKAEGAPGLEMMNGPMMQVLLEDRFKLKIHRETRDAGVYELTVAKSGPKLQVAQAGSCVVRQPGQPLPQPPSGKPLRICGGFYPESDGEHMYGSTMANLASQLSVLSGQHVIDKTGIAGAFDFHLDLDLDKLQEQQTSGARPAEALKAFADELMETAIPALGLKLVSAKGPVQILVIDSVERPSVN